MLTVTTCPTPPSPAVELCLAFVLIPSHHWVQAPGPPTQLCQRLPKEDAQIWPGCLNYRSAPKTGHIIGSIRFQRNKQTNKQKKSVERHRILNLLTFLNVFNIFYRLENRNYVWRIQKSEACWLSIDWTEASSSSFALRLDGWLVHLQSAVTEHSTADARTNKSLMFWLPHICGQRQWPLCQRRYDCTTLQQAWWHPPKPLQVSALRVIMHTEEILCRSMTI